MQGETQYAQGGDIRMYLQTDLKTVDPDQLAFKKPADLDLHYFQNRTYLGLAWQGLKTKNIATTFDKCHHY